MDVNPVVVGPHEGKIDPIDVAGLEEPLLQTTLKKRPILVVVPVKNKMIDAMLRGREVVWYGIVCGISAG